MTLERDLGKLEADSKKPNPFQRYFLLKNPFPGDGEVAFDVCADQEDLRRKFMSILQDFSSDAKRLYISGTNGAGKTNILKYFELLTNAARKRGHIKNLHPIYVESPGENVFDVHGQIVGSLAALFLDVILEKRIDSDFIDSLQLADEFSSGIKSSFSVQYDVILAPTGTKEKYTCSLVARVEADSGRQKGTVLPRMVSYGYNKCLAGPQLFERFPCRPQST